MCNLYAKFRQTCKQNCASLNCITALDWQLIRFTIRAMYCSLHDFYYKFQLLCGRVLYANVCRWFAAFSCFIGQNLITFLICQPVLNNIDPPHRKIFSLPIIIVACTAWSSDYPLDGSLSVNCRKMDYNQHQLWPITRRMSPVFYNDFHPIPVSKNCKWQWRIMNEWASYNWMKRPPCFAVQDLYSTLKYIIFKL